MTMPTFLRAFRDSAVARAVRDQLTPNTATTAAYVQVSWLRALHSMLCVSAAFSLHNGEQ